uniref:Ig-like domain-containing protein n=1 Tax=Labrus bergylta TaxID=56723 RepID=A0A3Q3DZ81_9LABR
TLEKHLKNSFLHFQTVSVGESVTLPCACQDETAVMFYWYKRTLGQIPQLMTTFYNKYALKILDFGISDSATYFCIGSDLYNFEFCQSTTVSTKDLDIQAIIHQSVSETTTKPGDMTLTCTVHPGTCDGEHNVYWFKNSEESHPGLIYTHGGRNDQCERNPTPQTHSCVYNLPMTNLNLSHAGTYYCAVASCGHILFGNGTKLDFHSKRLYVNISIAIFCVLILYRLMVAKYQYFF